MYTPNSKCSNNFYKDVGFNYFIKWLKDNCHCSANHKYFDYLKPETNENLINISQYYTEDLLLSIHNNNQLPIEFIPDISSIMPSLRINDFRLSKKNSKPSIKY